MIPAMERASFPFGTCGRHGFANSATLTLFSLLFLAPIDRGSAASFIGLGGLPGGAGSGTAWAVSGDGTTVVGESFSASGVEAFRWTSGSGMQGLGDLPGGEFYSRAFAVSADGQVVVGDSYSGADPLSREAFQWTGSGGMVTLGDFTGGFVNSGANGVSADGSVIVGSGARPSIIEGFIWTMSGGLVGLGDLPGGVFQSVAYAVSADGTTVVGESYTAAGSKAFRWTGVGGMIDLGDLPGGLVRSKALAVSSDGSVVVGSSVAGQFFEAFRWNSGQGMVGLGSLEAVNGVSEAVAVSGDGKVVVGWSSLFANFSGRGAFIWDEQGGMRSLQTELKNVYGLNLTGWQLSGAVGISHDGRTIVGNGFNSGSGVTEPWLARIDPVIIEEPLIYEFSGPLKLKPVSVAGATYHAVQIDEVMEGELRIGASGTESQFVPPDTYEFSAVRFYGKLLGNEIETSTAGSIDPLEVSFRNDAVADTEALALVNALGGSNYPEGTQFDFAEIATQRSSGNRRIEFGVSFISADLGLLTNTNYRAFPLVADVDLAIYFVVEFENDVEIFNAIGQITEFHPPVSMIDISTASLSGGVFTIGFSSVPGVKSWQVKGGSSPAGGYPDNLTGPGTTIIEGAAQSGDYTAEIDVTGRGPSYFVRIQK